jgi:carbonic anhydrase
LNRTGRVARFSCRQRAGSLYAGFVFVGLVLILAGPLGAAAITQPSPGEAALKTLLDANQGYSTNRGPVVCPNPALRPFDGKQQPKAAILSCSDARVPPEIFFNQGMNALFVVREAGNTYNELGQQSLEYAVTNLHTPLIVVIGHDSCGAVTAAAGSYPKPGLGALVTNIYPAVRAALGMNDRPNLISNAINWNAILMARKLAKEKDFEKRISDGSLVIVAARYNMTSGLVTVLEKETAAH